MALCWKERSVIGDTISSRGGHTLTPVRTLRNLCRHLIHFGGADAFGVASCDVHVIATTPNSGDTPWTSSKALHNDNTPVIPTRMGHSAIAIPDDEAQLSAACRFLDRVVVFGGSVSLPEPLLYNDIWQLRVKRSFVRRGGAPASEEILVVEWTNLTDQVTGDKPAPRHAHSCGLSDGMMVVAGGAGAEGLLSDAYALNLQSLFWTRIATHPSLAREMAAMTSLNSSSSSPAVFVITGGRDERNILRCETIMLRRDEKACWSVHSSLDDDRCSVGTGRCCHALLSLSPTVLLNVGGFIDGPDQFVDSVVALSVDDVAAAATAPIRRIDLRGTEFMLGFGQSSATWIRDSESLAPPRYRHCICSGIFPNAVSHSNSIYELVLESVLP